MTARLHTLSFKIFIVVSIITCMVVASAYTPEAPAVATKKIQDALIGATETMLSVGKFESSDGLTKSLSQNGVSSLISDFNNRVDLYYASENPLNSLYKQINEELLSKTFLTEIDYIVDCGVLEYELLNIGFNDSYTEATVEASLVCWNKWIDEQSDLYRVCSPVNLDTITAKMILENGDWKVLDFLNIQQEFGYLQEKAVTFSQTQDEIARVEKLTGKYSYQTFEEALSSANTIDVTKINPFE